jgi:hypothetical protein
MTGLGKTCKCGDFLDGFLGSFWRAQDEKKCTNRSLRGEETFSNWMQRDGNGGIGIVESDGGGG